MTKIEPVDHFYRRMADDIVMKIDVEGHEQATFRGAAEALRQSRRVVVFVEMHRAVIDRTGISPEMIFAAAEAHRPCVWFLAEPGLPPIDRSRPFFEQFPVEQHDVIGLMHEDGASPGQ